MSPSDMPDFWPEAEKLAACTCGLGWMGYKAGPFIKHASLCNVAKAHAALCGKWIADRALDKVRERLAPHA